MDPGDPSAVPEPAAYTPPPPSPGKSENNQLQEVRGTTDKFNQAVKYRATHHLVFCCNQFEVLLWLGGDVHLTFALTGGEGVSQFSDQRKGG